MKPLNAGITCLPLFLLLCGFLQSAFAQGTTLTYQGRLCQDGVPVSGGYDFVCRLYDASTGGNLLAIDNSQFHVPVTNGLFTITLDFGQNFPGAERWLEISLGPADSGVFNTLLPRQRLTPTPYAIMAASASNALTASSFNGSIGLAQLPSQVVTNGESGVSVSGTFSGNGTGVSNVNAIALSGFGANQFWNITGNSNTVPGANFLGTSDNRAFELNAGGLRVLRLEPDPRPNGLSGNSIGGFTNNAIEQPGSGGDFIAGGGYAAGPNIIHSNSSGVFIGAGSANQIGPNVNDSVIGGGYGNSIQEFDSVIGGGVQNVILVGADRSVIGGGAANLITGSASLPVFATISGGQFNAIQTNTTHSTISGGWSNSILAGANSASIGGGYANVSGANGAAIGGGWFNTANGGASVVPGGYQNQANGLYSFAAGTFAEANHTGAFVWSDSSSATPFASTLDNQFSVRAFGGVRFVTAGAGMTVDGANVALRVGGNTFVGNQTITGKVGIGTTNPVGILDVFGQATIRDATGVNGITLNPVTGGAQQLYSDYFTGGTERPLAVGTYSNRANQLYLATSGNVGIGTTTPSFMFEVNGSAGKPGGGSWSVASDERLKKNIRPLAGVLEKLLELHGVNFEYVDPGKIHELPGERMGLIAQEVERVFPDWVEAGADGYKRVTVRGLEALMVEAFREIQGQQQAAQSAKDKEIQQLQKQNEILEQRLQRLEQLMSGKTGVGK